MITETSTVRALPHGVALANPWTRLAAYALEDVLIVATLGIGWVVWAAIIAGNGQTPAKQILGLRVVDKNTLRPIGLARMFWARGVLAFFASTFIISVTLGIALLMPLWKSNRQSIWDKVSKTYVVQDVDNAWAMPTSRTIAF